MASRRKLKKVIKAISESLLCDCIALNMVEEIDNQAISALTSEVVAMEKEYVMRISHTEHGSEKLFYKKLRDEFAEKANDLAARLITI